MERLSSFDASFLANERGHAHMAIGAVLIFRGSPPTHEEFLAHVRSRLHLLPRLRQRLLFGPLGLGTPFWIDHPRFDLHQHISRLTLPAPGPEARLREIVGELLSPPLERSRPLWELTLVEGLEGDRFAIVYKTHHAMADGISAVDIGMLLFDVDPDAPPADGEVPWVPRRPPGNRVLLVEALRGLGASLGRLGRWTRRAAREPGRARRRALDGLAGVWEVTWNLARPAPRVPINREIGPGRGYRWSSFDLAAFKAVKNSLGGTVNDVSLAVATGALRRLLADLGTATDGIELKALVPVSIRHEDEHGELGNKLTAMRGPLPVGVADPARRLRIISAGMERLKASRQPLGAEAIWGLNDWFRDFAPPLLLGPTAAINFSTRLFNLLVTNFPGPQMPFYVLGRELTQIHPVGFLAEHHGLAIAILSYHGQVSFGLLADPEIVPDLDRLEAHVRASFEELAAVASAARSVPPARTATTGG